ncbi:hypothetical protein KK062_22345 [Fulvivirgaceae bacterium PWU5]|uniref:Uncharacterized protein n=1 Tax=Dawidia cretensis TaxID=2782350 RepID=A0AAP2GVR8_9BACT|nr:hypothetical protein [Dawidia cretensis]MBT1711000.1 hypothetical protein [Dawidia cretensis]
MKIHCTNTKTFELVDGSETLGQIHYDSLFSYKADARAGNNHYTITPKGIFSTTIAVAQHGTEVATMQMNWKGQIILCFTDGKKYLLKPAGTFLSKYALEDPGKQPILLLDPDFNWSKFNYNYTVSYETKPQDILLVLLATYAATYYISSMAGTM